MQVNLCDATREMMSTAPLAQYHHPSVNGSQEKKPGPSSLPGDLKRKRFWPNKPKKSWEVNITLEEAAKQELAAVPSKTPVSILQELLSRRGASPNYELVQIEGAIHEPTFRYRVTVADFVDVDFNSFCGSLVKGVMHEPTFCFHVTVPDFVALGIGRSKKEAKHAAAKNVLDKIMGKEVQEEAVEVLDEKKEELVVGDDEDDTKSPINPIGTLQELCMSRRWPPPMYGLNGEEGLPHERLFTITCTVYKFKETGTGKSKKLAKRQAAQKMWETLQAHPANEDEAPESPETALTRYGGLKNCKISTLTAPHTHKVAAFHKSLKTRTGEKLEELQTEIMSAPDFNFVQFLQEIAAEQHFEVTFVDVEETAKSGNYQCLVQLSTMPVAVCYGSGPSSQEAQSAAAHNALEYLKIMTKK